MRLCSVWSDDIHKAAICDDKLILSVSCPCPNETQNIVLTRWITHYILVLQSVPRRHTARVNREPGENPGLPRSGEQERTPSKALGRTDLGSDG